MKQKIEIRNTGITLISLLKYQIDVILFSSFIGFYGFSAVNYYSNSISINLKMNKKCVFIELCCCWFEWVLTEQQHHFKNLYFVI